MTFKTNYGIIYEAKSSYPFLNRSPTVSETFQILRDNNAVDELQGLFTEGKQNIKDVFCAVRFRDGGLHLYHETVPFETLCTISKMLDYVINTRQFEQEYETEEEDDEEDLDEDETE